LARAHQPAAFIGDPVTFARLFRRLTYIDVYATWYYTYEVKIFVVKSFERFIRKAGISDPELRKVVQSLEGGQIDAALGKHLFKQRIARRGGGKSGGYRTILMFRSRRRAVFLYGFEKNAKATLSPLELTTYQKLAIIFDNASDTQLALWCKAGDATEIEYESNKE
jgi:hypothetical protein